MRRELRLLAVLLLLVLGWEWSGLDLPVAAWLGGAAGFPARNSLWARGIGHDALRWAEALAWLLLAADALRRQPVRQGPSRAQRRWALAIGGLALLLVPALKSFSHTSCPWDLQGFGGTLPWVSHWRFGVDDGGPGHCFPSGHTAGVAAFAVWAWLWQRPRVWQLWAALLLLASAAQWVRGAHFVSHSLWAAWLSMTLSWALLRGAQAGSQFRRRRAAASGTPTPRPA